MRAADAPALPNDDWSISVPNDLGGLKNGLNGLGAWLAHHKVETEAENRAHLVFDEIVTNVIRYAYDDRGAHVIHVCVRIGGDDLTLVFEDDGKPFDPTSAPALVPAASLAQASIGGRGLMLVRAASRRIDYERTKNGHNKLTVILPRH
jgi:anti-sigma regulatory factor (Ser/Thr protein kinase)